MKKLTSYHYNGGNTKRFTFDFCSPDCAVNGFKVSKEQITGGYSLRILSAVKDVTNCAFLPDFTIVYSGGDLFVSGKYNRTFTGFTLTANKMKACEISVNGHDGAYISDGTHAYVIDVQSG
ncbi:MAG: hypothetical protein MJ072_06515, partial [Clostridia bacterium]|nr:hypothetical protein [Clostridia bacterium]